MKSIWAGPSYASCCGESQLNLLARALRIPSEQTSHLSGIRRQGLGCPARLMPPIRRYKQQVGKTPRHLVLYGVDDPRPIEARQPGAFLLGKTTQQLARCDTVEADHAGDV